MIPVKNIILKRLGKEKEEATLSKEPWTESESVVERWGEARVHVTVNFEDSTLFEFQIDAPKESIIRKMRLILEFHAGYNQDSLSKEEYKKVFKNIPLVQKQDCILMLKNYLIPK